MKRIKRQTSKEFSFSRYFDLYFILISHSALGDGWRAATIDTQTELKHIHEFIAPIDGAQSFFVQGSTNGGGIGDTIGYYEYRTDLSGEPPSAGDQFRWT